MIIFRPKLCHLNQHWQPAAAKCILILRNASSSDVKGRLARTTKNESSTTREQIKTIIHEKTVVIFKERVLQKPFRKKILLTCIFLSISMQHSSSYIKARKIVKDPWYDYNTKENQTNIWAWTWSDACWWSFLDSLGKDEEFSSLMILLFTAILEVCSMTTTEELLRGINTGPPGGGRALGSDWVLRKWWWTTLTKGVTACTDAAVEGGATIGNDEEWRSTVSYPGSCWMVFVVLASTVS